MENQDLRLIEAYQRIDKGSVDVLSLDIFDTLVWRKTPLPVDIFLLLGKQFKEQGWLIEAASPESFVELRYFAEMMARQKKAQEDNIEFAEVTLKEIYWNLSSAFNKITVEEMAQGKIGIMSESDVDDPLNIEVTLEKQLIEYDENIVRLIQYAVHRKIPVVLVSDTYFDVDHLETILDKPDSILPFIHKIYPSCEYGFGKKHGLFSKVLTDLNVLPEKLMHIGDNPISDTLSAKKEGIHAIEFEKYDKEITQIMNQEWSTFDVSMRGDLLDPQEGDFGLSSLRAKLYFDRANQDLSEQDAFYRRYGATVFGPFLMGFIHHIYDRCQAMNETKVFCLMREGRLYGDLIKKYAPYYPEHTIEPIELWVSRRYISNACILYGTSKEIGAVYNVHPAQKYTVGSFCAYLGLEVAQIPQLSKFQHVKLEDEKFLDEIADFLSNNDSLREIILENAASKRIRFLRYLSSLVDLSTLSRMVLVDIGWAGSIQGALELLLKFSGYTIPIHGLYLCTIHKAIAPLLRDSIREGYLLKLGHPLGDTAVIKRGLYVLEQTAVSNIGTLLDIDENSRIITDEVKTQPAQIHQSQLVVDGVHSFFDHIGRYIQSGKIHWNSRSEALVKQLRQILVRATGLPTKKEVQYFGDWGHDHVSAKDTDLHTIGNNSYYEHHIKDMLPAEAFNDWSMTWPAAYAAQSSETLALMAKVVKSGALPKECFLSEDAYPVKIYMDFKDTLSTTPAEVLSLRSNANRRFYAYVKLISMKPSPMDQIRIAIEIPSSYIQIESLCITCNDRLSPEPQETVYFESSQQKNTLTTSIPEIFPSTFLCGADPLILTCPLHQKEVYYVQIHLCFQILTSNFK